MPEIISVQSWESKQFHCEIFNLLTDQGNMKVYETQLVTPKETVISGNYIFFCSQVCKKSRDGICTENQLLKNRKCNGQFFYVIEENILNSKQK